jgi:hypothetical protein
MYGKSRGSFARTLFRAGTSLLSRRADLQLNSLAIFIVTAYIDNLWGRFHTILDSQYYILHWKIFFRYTFSDLIFSTRLLYFVIDI